MRFYHILHEKSIVHLLRTSWVYFRPPPPKKKGLEKKWTIFMYVFEEYLLSFVVLLTKIWPTNIYF